MFGGLGQFINNTLNAIIPNRLARKTRAQIMAQYGPPGDAYEAKYCTLWEVRQQFAWFPVKHFQVNVEFMTKLSEAFTQLEAEGLHIEIKTFDGCLVIRPTRGSTLPSLHSWGMAVDFNAATEPMGQTTTHFSDRFIEIMTAHVYWGGNFIHRKDPMHFSLYGE